MRFEVAALIAAAASASAQAVVGKAYGFASGVTGGGKAAAVTPTTTDELAKYLSDDTERVILITKEFDFTGKKATGEASSKRNIGFLLLTRNLQAPAATGSLAVPLPVVNSTLESSLVRPLMTMYLSALSRTMLLDLLL